MKTKVIVAVVAVIVVIAVVATVLVLYMPGASETGPIKIGAFMEYTGDWSGWGPIQDAEIDVFNSVIGADPPLGRTFQWLKYDMKSTAEGGLDAGKKMVSVDGAKIMTYADSVSYPAVRSWLIDSGNISKVYVNTSFGGGIPDEWGGTYDDPLFRTTMSDTAQAWAQADWAAELGFTSAVLLASETEEVVVYIDELQVAAPAKGIELLDVVTYRPGQTNYRDVLADVMASEPDLVFLGAMDEDAGIIWKQAQEMGFYPTWICIADVSSPRSIEIAGNIDYSKIWNTYPVGEGGGWEEFKAAWAAVWPNQEPYPSSPGAWDSIMTIALAIEEAGSIDTRALVDATYKVACPPGVQVTSYAKGIELIRAGTDIDFEGAASDVNFDERGDVWGVFAKMKVQNSAWTQFGTIRDYY